MGNTKIATYIPPFENEPGYPIFSISDPVTGSSAQILEDGTLNDRTELAALGTSVPLVEPPVFPSWENVEHGFVGDAEFGCRDEHGDPEPCLFTTVRAQRAEDFAERRRRKKEAKEPVGIVVPKNNPKLPWVSPEKGPSAALAASYSYRSDPKTPEDELPDIGETFAGNVYADPLDDMMDASQSGVITSAQKRRPRARFSMERFKLCLSDLFHTTVGLPDGRTEAFDKTGFRGFSGNSATPFSVDFEYKTRAEIKRAIGKDAVGYSPADWSRTVFIANGQSAINDLATRIHELGNKIFAKYMGPIGMDQPEATNALQKKLIANKVGDTDAGMALEECVFGGRVMSDDTVLR